MTIQQHASFDSSAAELNATSKLVKAWESKNAKNAAKAGGVSLMAVSLAACGGSSEVAEPTVLKTVYDAAVTAQAAAEAEAAAAATAQATAEAEAASAAAAQAAAEAAQAAAETAQTAAETAQAAAEADSATAATAQAEAEAAQTAAEAAQAAAEVAQATAEADAASAAAAKVISDAAQATAEAALATLQATYDALATANAALQADFDALFTPASLDLTSAADDLGTDELSLGNDTINGSVRNTLASADSIVDGSGTDNDTLTAYVSGTPAPTLTNIENVVLTGSVRTVNLSMANVTGTDSLSMDTDLSSGTATLTNAHAVTLTAGSNVTTVAVNAVDAGGTAGTVTVTGSGITALDLDGDDGDEADTFVATVAADADVDLGAADAFDADDSVTLNLGGDATITGDSVLGTLAINATAGSTLTVDGDLVGVAEGDAFSISGGNVTLDLANTNLLDGMTGTMAGGTLTVQADAVTAADDLSSVEIDLLEITGAAANDVTVSEATTVNMDADAGALTVDTANAGETLTMTISEDQSTQTLTIGAANAATASISATVDDAGETITVDALDMTGLVDGILTITGSDDLVISDLVHNAADIVLAGTMTGDLNITATTNAALEIETGSGDDSITGSSSTDTISAGDGDNTIDGLDGVDSITVGDGDNGITGGTAADTITAGDGDNTIDAEDGAGNVVTAGDGDNGITGGSLADTITVGDGDNTIDVEEGANTITAGDGDNGITGGSNADTITVGDGDNTIDTEEGAGTVTAGDGANTITGGSNADTITVGDGGNTIDAEAGANTITAGDGDDSIIGTTGADTIVAGGGADTINAGLAVNTLTLGAGADTVQLTVADSVMDATDDTTITDFVIGTDILSLDGTATDTTIDVSDVAVNTTTDVYTIATGDFLVTLTDNTGTDLSGSIQLGTEALEFTIADDSTIVAGDLADFIVTAADESATLTLGGGADTVVVAAGAGADVVTVTDFVVGTDKIIITGTADENVDLTATQAAATYEVGADLAVFTLTGATATSIEGIAQLGYDGNVFTTDDDGTVVGSDFGDFITTGTSTTAAGTSSVTAGGGKDYVTIATASEIDTVVIADGDSTTTAWDEISGWDIAATAAAGDNDVLDLDATNVAATIGSTDVGSITGATLSNGVITAWAGLGAATVDADNLADAIAFLQANISGSDTAAFTYTSDENADGDTSDTGETSTFVFQQGTVDTLIEIIDLTGVTAISTVAAADTIGIA